MAVTQADIDKAITDVNAAKGVLEAAKARMDSWCSLVSQRKYTEGSSKLACSKKVPVVCGDPIDAICCKSSKYSDSTCEGDKSTYNSSVLSWEQSQDALALAEDRLSELQDQLADQNQNQYDSEQDDLDRKASQNKVVYWVFGIISIVVVVGVVFLTLKIIKN